MNTKIKRPYSRHGFPMNLGLQKYILCKMVESRNIQNYMPDGWENELDSTLTLPEQFEVKTSQIIANFQLNQRNINSDRLFRLENEINMLINEMYLRLTITEERS